jgi:cytosol alanyl aminopeptidase
MKRLLVLLVLVGCATARPKPTPSLWRLPDTAIPRAYDVELMIDPRRDMYIGRVRIEIEITQPVSDIRLNASLLRIDSAQLVMWGKRVDARPYHWGDVVQLRFAKPVQPGRGQLEIAFAGWFNTKSDEGLFRRASKSGSWWAYSRFAPASARRAIPCFDEPQHKVPWKIALVVPKELAAYSNGRVISDVPAPDFPGMHRVTFAPTPPLPSFLVALTVGRFERHAAGKIGVIVPLGADPSSYTHAASVMPPLLATFEAYFGRAYPYEKLDLLSVPTTTWSNEYPGLSTVGAQLLGNSEEARRIFDQSAAHLLAHQWFGNLVTTRWWDDIWLYEAFVTWLGREVVSDPREAIATARTRNKVMLQDNLPSVRLVREPVRAHSDIAAAFDDITYEKGAAVLGMLHCWLGEESLRAGVRAFIDAHANGSATTADFAAALTKASGRDVGPVLHAFLEQPGFPLVTVEIHCDGAPRANLVVEPYLALGVPAPATPRRWPVPLCLRHEQGTTCALVAEKAEMALPLCPAWIAPNAGGVGYFRTMVDPARLDPSALTIPERVDLAGNTAALVRAGRMSIDDAVALLARIPTEGILDDLAAVIEEMTAGDEPSRDRAVAMIIGPTARMLGWSAVDEVPRALYYTIAFARDEGLANDALALTTAWLDGGERPAGNVMRAAAQFGDRKLFDRLMARLPLAKDPAERKVILEVIGALRDPALAGMARDLAVKLPLPLDERIVILSMQFQQGHEELRVAVRRHLEERGPSISLEAQMWFSWLHCSRADAQAIQKRFQADMEAQPNGPRRLARIVEETERCAGFREANQR